jgi:putative ABC transport system permease protein
VLLLVNLFVMLAAERKPELGMARAIGMRRSWARRRGSRPRAGSTPWPRPCSERSPASGSAVLIIRGLRAEFSTEHNRFDLVFTVRGPSIAEGFAIGLLFALVTVVATSIRISRLNIIAAIRDLPDVKVRRHRLRWLVLGAAGALLGAAWTLNAVPEDEPFGLLLGPTLVAAGLSPSSPGSSVSARRSRSPRPSSPVWGVLLFALFPKVGEDADMMVWVAQGVTLTGAAVVLTAVQQEHVARTIRKLTPGRGLALRLGLAYPLARRSRTGLTVAMYALVVFILTFITTLVRDDRSRTDKAAQKVAGGYAVAVSSSTANPIPIAQLTARPGVRAVHAAPHGDRLVHATRHGVDAVASNRVRRVLLPLRATARGPRRVSNRSRRLGGSAPRPASRHRRRRFSDHRRRPRHATPGDRRSPSRSRTRRRARSGRS